MHIDEKGVLKNSSIYFHTPSNLARDIFFFPINAGEFYCDENYHVKRDSYNNFLLMYIRKGTGTISYNNKFYTVSEGSIVLLNCYYPHEYFTNKGWETVWIHYDGNTSRQFFDLIYNHSGCVIPLQGSGIIPEYIRMILNGFKSLEQLSEPLISCYIQRILTELLLISSDFTFKNKDKSSPVLEAMAYIESNFKEKLSLKKISSHINMSVYYFSRKFKKECGYSPYEYILKTRINHAKLLLKNTKLRVKEIAFESGFSSESNFVYTFRNSVGMSPGEFRNMPF